MGNTIVHPSSSLHGRTISTVSQVLIRKVRDRDVTSTEGKVTTAETFFLSWFWYKFICTSVMKIHIITYFLFYFFYKNTLDVEIIQHPLTTDSTMILCLPLVASNAIPSSDLRGLSYTLL